jgi:hypothetical protein
VKYWKGATSLKNISDGTSNTLLAGELGRASAESGHAYNGDFTPYEFIGHLAPFCQRCGLPPKPPTATDAGNNYGDYGFGSNHPGVVLFVMCDASVRPISVETDLNVLDRASTRAGDDNYDLSGTASTCP